MGRLDEMFSACRPVPGDYVHPLDPDFDVDRMVEENGAERWVAALDESQIAEDFRADYPDARPNHSASKSYPEFIPWRERVDELTEAELLDFELLEFYEDEEWRQRYIVPTDYLNPLPDPQPSSSIDSSGHVPGPGGSVDRRPAQRSRPPKRKAEDQLFGRLNKIARPFQGVEIDYSIHHGDGLFRPTMGAIRRSTAEDHCYAKPAAMDPGPVTSVDARDYWATAIEPWLRRDRAHRLRYWALNVQYNKARRETWLAYKAEYQKAYKAALQKADDIIQSALSDLGMLS